MRRIKTLGLAFIMICLAAASVSGAAMETGTFKPEGKGYFYYSHSLEKGAAGQENLFEIFRMYFGGKYQVSEEFIIRYLTDMGHKDKTGQFETFAKYAYLDWKLNKYGGHLFLGLQGTHNWKVAEKAWGYRSIRWSPMESFGKYWSGVRDEYDERIDDWVAELEGNNNSADSAKAVQVANQGASFRTGSDSKMASSADLGVGLTLKPTETHYVSLMIRNGTGYKKAENDMYKNFQARVGFYFLEKALHLSAFAELEPWGGIDASGEPKSYTNFQWDLLASYERKGKYLVGININSKIFPGIIDDITGTSLSWFGNVYLKQDKLKALARYDIYKTGFNDVQLQPGATWKSDASLLILGLDYIAHKNVHIIPNVQILSFEDGDLDSEGDFFVHAEFSF